MEQDIILASLYFYTKEKMKNDEIKDLKDTIISVILDIGGKPENNSDGKLRYRIYNKRINDNIHISIQDNDSVVDVSVHLVSRVNGFRSIIDNETSTFYPPGNSDYIRTTINNNLFRIFRNNNIKKKQPLKKKRKFYK